MNPADVIRAADSEAYKRFIRDQAENLGLMTPAAAFPTKRELFAAMALQGAMAPANPDATSGELATWAVRCADALIAALAKEPKP